MAELTIYDSRGKPYKESGGTGQPNELIKNFFFGGVKVYADFGSQTKIAVFFRARESNAGRAEQYYAVYQTRSRNDVFGNLKADLRQRVEGEYGMSIQTDSDDVDVFRSLEQTHSGVPGSEFDHELIEKLLNSGQRLRFGVSSTEDALGLFDRYGRRPAQRIAIADNPDVEQLENCDLAISVGNYSGLEPIGETERLMREGRSRYEEKFIGQKVSNIRAELSELRSQSTKTDEEIRHRLKRDLSIFESPPPNALGKQGKGGPLSQLGTKTKVAVVSFGVVVAAFLVLLVAVNLLAVAGYSAPTATDSLVVVSDDDEATLEQVTVEGAAVHNLTEGGEFVNETQTVEPVDGELTVSGVTNQDHAQVSFTPADGGEPINETYNEVTNESFSITLEGIETGGDLTISAGEWASTDEYDWLINGTVTLEVEASGDENGTDDAADTDDATDGDETDGEASDDTGETDDDDEEESADDEETGGEDDSDDEEDSTDETE
ncbi:hypothetical protein [Natrarchaeobius oligotrophus]|uniref:Uncharacterized protein n=1 Tax=Natrarchaeobius chitinivorans TaxID=1679083 RepID=A0A3N6MWN6_NATCH|nr:hypothetical protein [Natrarchaeobius chitinivorans]RQG99386.1 hypothetical protein EA472_14260 [Natrarchaeobius chitinivorans]